MTTLDRLVAKQERLAYERKRLAEVWADDPVQWVNDCVTFPDGGSLAAYQADGLDTLVKVDGDSIAGCESLPGQNARKAFDELAEVTVRVRFVSSDQRRFLRLPASLREETIVDRPPANCARVL